MDKFSDIINKWKKEIKEKAEVPPPQAVEVLPPPQAPPPAPQGE